MRVHFELQVAPDWWPLTPSNPDRMLGGTERVVLRLARELAGRGHDVSLRGGGAEGLHDGVRFLLPPHVLGPVDALVCVHAEPPADAEPRVRIAWSHAAQWPTSDHWDAVVVGSRYHADVLHPRLPCPIEVVPPGIDSEPDLGLPRDRFLWASSPDRGLHRLLAIWPELWRRFEVPLAIAYDIRAVFARYARASGPLAERLRAVTSLLDQPGILVQGPLSEDRRRALRARSLALLYPLDPVIPHSELLSLAVREACAAGCPPVLAPIDAFPAEYRDVARFVEPHGPRYDAASWIGAVRETLDDRGARAAAARAFAAGFRWEDWVDRWTDVLAAPRPERPPASHHAGQRWIVVADDADRALARLVADAAGARGHTTRLLPPNDETVRAVAAGADRVVLCPSGACTPYLGALGSLGVPIASVETTLPERLDGAIRLACLAWPQRVLDAATAGRSPIWPVSPDARDRIRAVGWFDGPAPSSAVVRPDALAVGHARAAGAPMLVRASGRAFGPERYAEGDRFAHALFLAGEAEVAHHDASVARPLPLPPSGGGAERAVRLIEALTPPVRTWRPPELRA